MSKRTKTEQELFWEGEFGDGYTERNQLDPALRAPRLKQVLDLTTGVHSVCELGANRGLNVRALHQVDPNLEITAIEVNTTAFTELAKVPNVRAIQSSIQDFVPPQTYDLTFTCGVLIHINPNDLPVAFQRLYEASRRYVLIAEYINPVPVELEYRGHSGRLFKRDFAGDFIDQIGPGKLEILDYGFWWRRVEPQWDDLTWTLMRKASGADNA